MNDEFKPHAEAIRKALNELRPGCIVSETFKSLSNGRHIWEIILQPNLPEESYQHLFETIDNVVFTFPIDIRNSYRIVIRAKSNFPAERLEPCPYCGGELTHVNAKASLDAMNKPLPTYYVICLACGARGPVCTVRNNAVSHWNSKATDSRLVKELLERKEKQHE